MRIGIIAEGSQDQLVIRNILRAFGIDKSDVLLIKPYLEDDETGFPDDPTIGTFQGVKNACLGFEGKRHYFIRAFDVFKADFMVIHIDTAEIDRQDFEFVKPNKADLPTYCTELREKAIVLINEWLEGNYSDKILYAIAIEEMEAWLLTLHAKSETAQSADAKEKWKQIVLPTLNERSIDKITKDFSKKKELKKYLPYNQSLREFVEALEKIVKP
ncbi:MAG: hypothetical protein EAZ95_19820 [Bacteroidetes bacterium]|nr:MAG: hypothetical protein EAZ95_19820 [Bacteroidota bacterium]